MVAKEEVDRRTRAGAAGRLFDIAGLSPRVFPQMRAWADVVADDGRMVIDAVARQT
jgi:hypothetical protein